MKLDELQKNDLLDISNASQTMSLDVWFDIWLSTIEVNLMQSSKNNTTTYYNRVNRV